MRQKTKEKWKDIETRHCQSSSSLLVFRCQKFSQVHHLLTSILLVTFFLNVVFRCFLVFYAEGFLQKGTLNLKLFKQLYWLLWVALVTLGLIPFAITPIMLGKFPTQDSYRKQLCLGALVFEKEEKDANPFGTRILMVLMIFYILRFVCKAKSFVHGQCSGGKMCSIGKFQRNVIGLRITCFVALILPCLIFVLTFIRELTQNMDKTKAFFVNFVLFDGLIYLLAFGIFLFARSHDIPTRKDAAKHVDFYVSKVQVLKPRKPDNFSVPSQCYLNQVDQISPNTTIPKPADMKPDRSRFSGKNPVWTGGLRPKSCDRFWIRRVVSDNKIHPIVTIYDSSVKVEPQFRATNDTLDGNQPMRKEFSRKELEMSDNHPSIENPNAIISFPSEVVQVHVPNVGNSEKRLVKDVQRFRYFTKDWKDSVILQRTEKIPLFYKGLKWFRYFTKDWKYFVIL